MATWLSSCHDHPPHARQDTPAVGPSIGTSRGGRAPATRRLSAIMPEDTASWNAAPMLAAAPTSARGTSVM